MYMRDLLAIDATPLKPAVLSAELAEPADVISAVFALLDREAIAYCVPHGAEGLPERHGSDVDIIVLPEVAALDLQRLLRNNEPAIGARLVRAKGYYLTLECRDAQGFPAYVTFDFATRYVHGNLLLADAAGLLQDRLRCRCFWGPAAGKAFALRLARGLLKNRLDAATLDQLATLYRSAPAEARTAMLDLWPQTRADQLAAAAATGQWQEVMRQAPHIRAELRRHILWRHPGAAAALWMEAQAGRFRRLLRPEGLNIVMLGPDGAGKSSTIDALERCLTPLFARTEVRGFAPSLKQVLRKSPASTATPHALKPRSAAVSLLRAGWWTAYGLFSHASLYLARARSTLVLNDRHFIDILVDPVRYRYGGPRWLLSWIARLLPRPQLIILLNGPPEVLQARKRELTVEETARQCRAYLSLVRPMRNAHVIDATQPHPEVVRAVADLAVAKLARQHFAQPGE